MQKSPAYLTVREVRAQLSNKISASTVYQLFARGKLRGVKLGGRVLIEASSFNELLAAGRVAAVAPRRTARAKQRREYKHFSLD